jgi:hypothetical protein
LAVVLKQKQQQQQRILSEMPVSIEMESLESDVAAGGRQSIAVYMQLILH